MLNLYCPNCGSYFGTVYGYSKEISAKRACKDCFNEVYPIARGVHGYQEEDIDSRIRSKFDYLEKSLNLGNPLERIEKLIMALIRQKNDSGG